KQIMVLAAAMPTAANTTLMAVQFETKPAIVSSATFISTMLSIVTLPVVLWLLSLWG
ncbi:AEC family transporter, partial [Bacillus licheniformis]|uniref:AEC family transporter n=1 Tax=Bacillus licheniformis TaxID=1402 RepID=UPI0030EE4859|nr:AEC family transporter [Bacillus licheniformis]